ncbi:hypothetical protein ACWEPN_10060 [Nonomuraea wenchangensis]
MSAVHPRKWQDVPVDEQVDEQRARAIRLLNPKVKKLRDEAGKGIKTRADDAVDGFLAHGFRGRSLGTITHARSMAENQIKPKIGNYRLNDLRAEHVDL